MKFNEYPYQRIDYDSFKKDFDQCTLKIAQAKDAKTVLEGINQASKLESHLMTMTSLCSIRFSINVNDKYYSAENDYWDDASPKFQEIINQYYLALTSSPYRSQLYDQVPEVFFQRLDDQVLCFDSRIIPDLQQENKYVTQYASLVAKAQIPYEGKNYTLSQLKALMTDVNRETRKTSSEAYYGYYAKHQSEFDQIYDNLVQIRTKIAKTLGFKNYVELAYKRMERIDYDEKMVAQYRQEIVDYITPLAVKLRQKTKKRLGLDTMHYYDAGVDFKDGNAKPLGDADTIISNGVKMYHDLSPETSEFIDFMIDHDLMNLLSTPGKQAGGYSTGIPDYKAPFIFANFRGTLDDVGVLTHEAGHAFQGYESSWITIPEITSPTMESCEIHSMSMEFFTWKYMELFFGDKADRYRYTHLMSTITFLPYGALVDHFQHVVYEHPEYTPAQRDKAWRDLEKVYIPDKNYEGNELLENGGWWYQQLHIFHYPFYYIDYTLAQVCALENFVRIQKKDPKAWSDYLALCKAGGTASFTHLVKNSGLQVPFDKGTVQHIAEFVSDYLDKIDDTKL